MHRVEYTQDTCTEQWAANPAEGGGWRTGPVRPPRHKKTILHESIYTNPAAGSVTETESAGWLPGAGAGSCFSFRAVLTPNEAAQDKKGEEAAEPVDRWEGRRTDARGYLVRGW